MHLDHGTVPAAYRAYIGRKIIFILILTIALVAALVVAVSSGAARISPTDVARSLVGLETTAQIKAIIWNIRLPQALAAITCGAALAISGAVMQSILRNPLGSPFTLGISHAAAFGAALSVMLLGGNSTTSNTIGAAQLTAPFLTTAAAFFFSLLAAALILSIARIRGTTPEIMVLTGVALGALFTAGTMFLQFFANDIQLAAMVFWTFGDTGRATWSELGFITVALTVGCIFFLINSWNFNAIDSGDETAKGLGVRVEQIRMTGMLLASLLTAVTIAFLGIIGFIGLIIPHLVRRVIGADHRFLLPASLVSGALLLLLSDTAARMILAPHVLPVSVLTSFLGAPAFFWLIIRRSHR